MKLILRNLIVFFLLSLFFSLRGMSQTTNDSTSRLSASYIASFPKDGIDIIKSPFLLSKKQAFIGFSLGVLGVLIYTQDGAIQSFSQRNRTVFTDNLSKYALEPWGRGIYTVGIMGLFYLHGMVLDNNRTKKVALLGVKTLLVTTPFILGSKMMFYRDRPFLANSPDPKQWHGIFQGLKRAKRLKELDFNTSFPSGHTTSAFAIATIINSEFKDKKAVTIVAYSLATLTGLSRIHDNKHWATDVLAGAAFGYGMAKVIVNRNNAGFQFVPYKTKTETGFFMRFPISG